jgi:hypothetical protein
MKRTAVAMVLVTALGGCMSVDGGPDMAGPVCRGNNGPVGGPPMIPGVQGPMGQGVPVASPYSAPMNATMARYMMNQSVPLSSVHLRPVNAPTSDIVQASANVPQGGMPGMAVPPGGLMTPPGMPMGPGMMPPGMMPPGKGMMPPGMMPPGANMMAASGPLVPPGAMPLGPPPRFKVARTQVRFVRPSGMKVSWFVAGPDGKPTYSSTTIETPGRYNFLQAAIYRLKLSAIEGRPGLELYPTLEVVPTNPRTEAFLAHNAVPVAFSKQDFDAVAEGNYLVKVIYLPNPDFQELAATGPDEIVSTQLEPGADPIKEALRRGSILLVLRMGNMDQEAPNTPPIDAPGPGGAHPMPHGAGMMHPGMMPPGLPAIAPGMGGPAHHGPGPMIPYTDPSGHGNPALTPGGGPMLGPMHGMQFGFPNGGGMGMGVGQYPVGMPMPPMQPMPPAAMPGPMPPAPPAGMVPHSQAPARSGVVQAVATQPAAAGSGLPWPPTPAALVSQDTAARR